MEFFTIGSDCPLGADELTEIEVTESISSHALTGDSISIVSTESEETIDFNVSQCQGMKGPKGDTGGFFKGSKVIPSGQTATIDSLQDVSSQWVLIAKDQTANQYRRRMVSALISGDYHTYDITGDSVAFKPLISIVNNQMILSVRNNHLSDIVVFFTRQSVII